MARASVELIVEAARAINPLRKVERQTKRVEQQFDKARRSTKRVEAALVLMGRRGINVVRDLEKNTARLGRTMGGLRGSIGKAVIGFAAFKSVQTGIQRLESERRIKLLGQRFGEVGQLQGAAAAAARKFNLSQTEANQSLADAFARLRPLGVSLKDITSTFGGFRTAAVLGGATAAEASAAFTQLSQALGSGALRGDEFRSIAEQAPLVLQAISDETGVAAGDLKEYAAQGLLTSDIVIKALKRIEAEGADRLAQALGGPAAKIKDFQNKVEDLQVAFTESAIPAITDSISDLGTVIKQLEPLIRGLGSLLAGVARTVGTVVENVASGGKTVRAKQLALQSATLQTNAKFGKPGIFGRNPEASAFFEQTLAREESRRLAIARGAVFGQLPPSAADIGPTPKGTSPIKLDPKKDGTGKTPGEVAGAIFQQQTRALEILQEESELGKQLLQSDHKRADAIAQINGLEGIGAQRRQQLIDITNKAFDAQKGSIIGQALGKDLISAQQLAEAQQAALQPLERQQELLEAKLNGNETEVLQKQMVEDIMKKIDGLNEDDVAAAVKKVFQLKQQVTETERLKAVQEQVADAIRSNITSAIMEAIDGAKTLGQAFTDLLKNIGNMALEIGISSLLKSIKFGADGLVMNRGKITPFAAGGVVNGPTMFPTTTGFGVMGEAGPEAIMPLKRGPGGRLGVEASGGSSIGGIVVNVDASNTSAEGDTEQGKQLGKVIGIAVRSEILKQQRPGGLLA